MSLDIMNKKIRIASNLQNLSIVESTIDEVNTIVGIPKENYGKILVSTLEAVNNAILHGNNSDPDKYVEIDIRLNGKSLSIQVSDEGIGFSPDTVPDPTHPMNLQEPNGRGVFLMSKLADKIRYSKRGNAVKMTFKNIIS